MLRSTCCIYNVFYCLFNIVHEEGQKSDRNFVSKINVVIYLNETHPGRNIGHKEQNIHMNNKNK